MIKKSCSLTLNLLSTITNDKVQTQNFNSHSQITPEPHDMEIFCSQRHSTNINNEYHNKNSQKP